MIGSLNDYSYRLNTWDTSKWYIHTFESNKALEPIEKNLKLTIGKTLDGTLLGNFGTKTVDYKNGINSLYVIVQGLNRYSTSNARQWLNSLATDTLSWVPTDNGDFYRPYVARISGTNVPGFMHSLEADFLNILSKIKVSTVLSSPVSDSKETIEDTYDYFFLPSIVQEYWAAASPNIPNFTYQNEGNYWPYWQKNSGLKEPQDWNVPNDKRRKMRINDKTQAIIRYRSPDYTASSAALGTGNMTNGVLHSIYGYTTYVPCCVIS